VFVNLVGSYTIEKQSLPETTMTRRLAVETLLARPIREGAVFWPD